MTEPTLYELSSTGREGVKPPALDVPEYELPARTVPEPAQQHHDPEVGVAAYRSRAVAAEGIVEIVAQKG